MKVKVVWLLLICDFGTFLILIVNSRGKKKFSKKQNRQPKILADPPPLPPYQPSSSDIFQEADDSSAGGSKWLNPHPKSWLTPHPTHPSIVDRMSGLPKNKLAVWLVSNCDTKRWFYLWTTFSCNKSFQTFLLFQRLNQGGRSIFIKSFVKQFWSKVFFRDSKREEYFYKNLCLSKAFSSLETPGGRSMWGFWKSTLQSIF